MCLSFFVVFFVFVFVVVVVFVFVNTVWREKLTGVLIMELFIFIALNCLPLLNCLIFSALVKLGC